MTVSHIQGKREKQERWELETRLGHMRGETFSGM